MKILLEAAQMPIPITKGSQLNDYQQDTARINVFNKSAMLLPCVQVDFVVAGVEDLEAVGVEDLEEVDEEDSGEEEAEAVAVDSEVCLNVLFSKSKG